MIDRSRLSVQLNLMAIGMSQYILDLMEEPNGTIERKIRLHKHEQKHGTDLNILEAILDIKRNGRRKFRLVPHRSENGFWNGYYHVLDRVDNSFIESVFDPNWRKA